MWICGGLLREDVFGEDHKYHELASTGDDVHVGQKTHSVWCITGQIGASSSCETVENLLEHQHTSKGDELDF